MIRRLLNNPRSIYLLLVIIFLAVFFIFLKYGLGERGGNIDMSKLPAEFLPSSQMEISYYKVKDSSDYRLFTGETLGTGASYESEKPLKETVADIYKEIGANGWIATAGSGQDENKTFFKLAKGQQRIFVVVTQINKNRSRVIIVPVDQN